MRYPTLDRRNIACEICSWSFRQNPSSANLDHSVGSSLPTQLSRWIWQWIGPLRVELSWSAGKSRSADVIRCRAAISGWEETPLLKGACNRARLGRSFNHPHADGISVPRIVQLVLSDRSSYRIFGFVYQKRISESLIRTKDFRSRWPRRPSYATQKVSAAFGEGSAGRARR